MWFISSQSRKPAESLRGSAGCRWKIAIGKGDRISLHKNLDVEDPRISYPVEYAAPCGTLCTFLSCKQGKTPSNQGDSQEHCRIRSQLGSRRSVLKIYLSCGDAARFRACRLTNIGIRGRFMRKYPGPPLKPQASERRRSSLPCLQSGQLSHSCMDKDASTSRIH